MMEKTATFAETLKELRHIAGFDSAAEVAKLVSHLGYSKPSYSDCRRYELGETRPNGEQLAILVDVLGLSQKETMQLVRSLQPPRKPLRPERRYPDHSDEETVTPDQ